MKILMSKYATVELAEAAAIAAAERLDGGESLSYRIQVAQGRSYIEGTYLNHLGDWVQMDSGVDIIPDHRL